MIVSAPRSVHYLALMPAPDLKASDLKDRIAPITGAAGGIGQCLAPRMQRPDGPAWPKARSGPAAVRSLSSLYWSAA